ncbi:reverse transcriptase domain, reverse transcriptase zinc-binding domain protein [Tanacetum coccineum]
MSLAHQALIDSIFLWAREETPHYEKRKIQELEALTKSFSQLHLTNSRDSWEFTPFASRKFSVKAFRNIYTSSTTTMTQNLLNKEGTKCIPIKININSWRVANERLPIRVNLDRRGIDLHSVRCPICDDDLETENHIFVHCATAKQIWTDILKWWNLHNLTSIQNFFEASPWRIVKNSHATLHISSCGMIQI